MRGPQSLSHPTVKQLLDTHQFIFSYFGLQFRQMQYKGRWSNNVTHEHLEKVQERNTFVLLAVFLAPVLAVVFVGSYGLAVWISQLILGPPGSGF